MITQTKGEIPHGRLSVYLGRTIFGDCVRLDVVVIKDFMIGDLCLGLHEESAHDHIGQLIVWLGKHNEHGKAEIKYVVEFPVKEIIEYLHLMCLN